MADPRRWKPIFIRRETYELLRDIADQDPRPMSTILHDLILQEWRWTFERDAQRPEELIKHPERRQEVIETAKARNPFLAQSEDSGVDR